MCCTDEFGPVVEPQPALRTLHFDQLAGKTHRIPP